MGEFEIDLDQDVSFVNLTMTEKNDDERTNEDELMQRLKKELLEMGTQLEELTEESEKHKRSLKESVEELSSMTELVNEKDNELESVKRELKGVQDEFKTIQEA